MRSCTVALISLSFVFFSSGASADIESVVVYPDRASITRVVEVEVRPGNHSLELGNLPARLLRDSLRVSATGPSGLALGSSEFSTRRGLDQVNPRAQALSNQIQQLNDQQAVIDDSLQALQMQLNLLQTVSNQGDKERSLSLTELEQTLRLIGDSADEVLSQQRELNLEKRELTEQIQQLERELADLGQLQQDTTVLNLQYSTSVAGKARFRVEYVVPQAYWRPIYEWRLDTQTSQLEMVQSAIVQQNTGEDWSDVALSVSLARPSAGGQLPELQPWWIGVAKPIQTRSRMQEAELMSPAASIASDTAAGFAQANLAGTEYTQSYQIAGNSSLPSDNQERRFRLDSQQVAIELSARSVPARQTQAWLFVEGEFNGEAALPPGGLTLYQDGALVGQNYFDGIRPGASLASSFGVDDRIEIEYELQEQTQESEGVIRRSTQQIRQYKITASNRHTRPIKLTLLDQMPVSTDERIEVELTRDTTTPDQRNVDDRPGVIAWNLELDGGESKEIIIGYSISYPKDIEDLTGW